MSRQVDVLAVVWEERRVAAGLLDLGALYRGRPPDDFYWEAAVVLSYRLFRLGAVDEGMTVLEAVPPSFLRGEFVRRMEQDPQVEELARQIVEKLTDAEKVPDDGGHDAQG